MTVWNAEQVEATKDEEIEKIAAQEARIRARKAKKLEEKRRKKLKLKRRQAILLGNVMLEEVVSDKVLRARVERALNERLEKANERKVFGLLPRRKTVETGRANGGVNAAPSRVELPEWRPSTGA